MDDLSKRLNDANPHARAGLPPSAETLLRDIMSGRRKSSSTIAGASRGSGSSRTPAWATVVSAAGGLLVALLLVLALVVVADRPAAVAMTPDPLGIESTPWTLSSLRKEVAMNSTGPRPSDSTLGSSYEGWYLQMDESAPRDFIQRQRIVSEPGPDGSGVTVVLAGELVTRNGNEMTSLPQGALPPTTVVSETTWNTDEYSAGFPASPPDNVDAMREYLRDHLLRQGAEPGRNVAAGDYLAAAVTLLQTWTLDANAQRALIGVLLDSPGVGLLGGTVDRAGRPGVILDVAPGALGNPAFREHLIIDPTTWRVLAVESIASDPIPEYDVPAGTVTSYTLWN